MPNFEMRAGGQGNFATQIDNSSAGITYAVSSGDGNVLTVDPVTGLVTAVGPGVGVVQALKDGVVADEHHITVHGEAQWAFNVARRSGGVKVATTITIIPNDLTPPVVVAPFVGHSGGILTIDWQPPSDPESVYALQLDVRSLDNQVVLAGFLPVLNQARPIEFAVADTREYRVTLRATNAVGLMASAFTDITAGQNPVEDIQLNVVAFPDVVVSWTSEQNGERSYAIVFYDENDQPIDSFTVQSGPGVNHTHQIDLGAAPSGTYYVRIFDQDYADTNPPSPPVVVAAPNEVLNPDGGDNGDGTVTLSWENTANENGRQYTITVFDEAGAVVYTQPYTGSGTSQSVSIDLEALGLPPGAYSFGVVDAVTGNNVVSADFIYGGTEAGGEEGTLTPNAAESNNALATPADPLRPAGNAFDGLEATYYQSADPAQLATIGQAFGVGNEVEIGRLILIQDFENGFYATSGKVQYSADGVTWIDATPDTPFTGAVVEFDEIMPVGVQPFWQVAFTGQNPENKPVRVFELNMYPYAVPSEGFGQTPYGTGPYGF